MHLVSVNRGQRLISVTMSGFVSPTAITAAAADLHDAIHRLGGDPGDHRTLYDLSAVEIAEADVVSQFRAYFAEPEYAPIQARKVAFVTPSALFTLQLKRVQQTRDTIRTFADRPTALTWLLAA